jgi:serpin B
LPSLHRTRAFDTGTRHGDLDRRIGPLHRVGDQLFVLAVQGNIDQNTVLVLASAVHFQNMWKDKFTEIKNNMFCLSPDEHIEIQMMHRTGYYNYYKDDINKFAALEIPYQFGDFDLLVVLPDKMDGLKTLEKTFLSDSTKFPVLLASLTTHKVVLGLPKFKFESDLDLEKTMHNLGCGDMFTTGADFSKISSSGAGKLKVDSIKHRTLVDVNENGTEATGVTGTNIAVYSGSFVPPNPKTVHFHACHPFMFIIKKGNDIVFMGRLVNPNA